MSILARIAIAVLALRFTVAAQTVSIRLEDSNFKVVGWQAFPGAPEGGWSSIFTVYAGSADAPPMLGSYTVEDGSLVFRPRFPLAPGMHYRAVFQAPGNSAIEAVFDAPKAKAAAATRVERVYPSTDLLPENQLKFYLYFSAPMQRGEAWRRIHLLDQSGALVDHPFLEIDQELWDRDYKRLTVLFDPGRIKRGLVPRAESGPALEEGKRYTLVIDRDWLDASGAPLQQEFRKPFRAGPADRTPPDPKQWRLSVPRPATIDAVVVDFPKPMDYALLLRLLEIAGAGGTPRGSVSIERNETRWRFAPSQPWKAGNYKLIVDSALEDLAGNRIGRAFDVDTFDAVQEHILRQSISLPFRIPE